jgi:hypothetical protein
MASALALVIAATAGTRAGQSQWRSVQDAASEARFAPADVDTDGAPFLADGTPLYSRQTPPILRPDYTGTVELEIVYAGSFTHMRIFQRRNSGTSHVFDEYPRVETRTLEGRTLSVFRPSWTMGEFVLNHGLVIDFDSGVGARLLIAPSTVPLLPNGAPSIGDTVSVRAMTTTVATVPVVQIDAAIQYSSHVVNLVLPGMSSSLIHFDAFPSDVAAKFFYSYFGDDYEHLAFVFHEHAFARGVSFAFHLAVQNKISGIGMSLYNQSAQWGSAGRLEGVEQYVHTLDNVISNHELGHQWGHYLNWAGIAGITHTNSAHAPLWGNHESLVGAFIPSNLKLQPLGGIEWEAVRAPEPTQAAPLEQYAMGRLAASAVPPIDIFENQSGWSINLPGQRVSGATRRVTIDDIVAYHGPRVGPTITTLRRALILVSRDALATPAEMSYWTLLAQRLEDPQQTGMIHESGIGSFRAVTGVTLNTRVIPPTGSPTLTAHETLEPDVLDPRDMAGVVLDAGPRFDVPSTGIFRMKGRIAHPEIAGATRIAVQFGGNPTHPSSAVGPDGSFSIMGSPEQGVGRFTQRVYVTMPDGLQRTIASIRNIRVFQGPRVPPPPVALTATASGSNVTIQWSPDTGSPPTSYFVDVGSSSGAANIGSFPMTATTLTASGVPNGRYYLRVRAVNAAGVSAPSAETVLTVGCVPPQPPTTLTGTVSGASLTLAWQPSPTSGVSYTVIAGSSSGASNIAQAPVGTATTLSAAVPAGRYFIRIRAVTPCGSADSNEIDVVVGGVGVPGAPSTLTHQVTGGTVSFSWQAATGVVGGYVLEAGSQPGASNLAVVPIGNVLSFSAPGVPSGTYYVRVRAFNATGQGPPSNETVVVMP